MLVTKINKNHVNIPQKTTLKIMFHLGSISGPSWLDFGKVFGAKMRPSWFQIVLNIVPKNNPKNDHLANGIKIDFSLFLGPTWEVRWRSSGVRRGTFWHLALSWNQDGPQTAPRPFQGLIFLVFGPQVDGFWTPTWWILDPNLLDFGSQLGGVLIPCWWICIINMQLCRYACTATYIHA